MRYLLYILLLPLSLLGQAEVHIISKGYSDASNIHIQVDTMANVSDSVRLRFYTGAYPREHWFSLHGQKSTVDSTTGCWSSSNCTGSTWTTSNTWVEYFYRLEPGEYELKIYDGYGDGFNNGQVEYYSYINGAWVLKWSWVGINNTVTGSGYGAHTNWQIEGTRAHQAGISGWVVATIDTTDGFGKVFLPYKTPQQYRVTLDGSHLQHPHSLFVNDYISSLILEADPQAITSFDWYCADINQDNKFTISDLQLFSQIPNSPMMFITQSEYTLYSSSQASYLLTNSPSTSRTKEQELTFYMLNAGYNVYTLPKIEEIK